MKRDRGVESEVREFIPRIPGQKVLDLIFLIVGKDRGGVRDNLRPLHLLVSGCCINLLVSKIVLKGPF